MSDTDEPAAKMLKMETSSQETEDELDEGQEEWLSEGILTDDDGTTMPDQVEQTHANLDSTKSEVADETLLNDECTHETDDTQDELTTTKAEDIEQALVNMEKSSQNSELPEGIESYLVHKGVEEAKEESDIDESTKQSDDDGHSTDELLRMLGEDDRKAKSKELTKKKSVNTQTDETTDDEELFKQSNLREVRVAKSILKKKTAVKAEPEDMSDGEGNSYPVRKQNTPIIRTIKKPIEIKTEASDKEGDSYESSDEVTTMKRIFGMARERATKVAEQTTGKAGVIRPSITVTKKAVIINKTRGKPEIRTITRDVQSIIKKPTFSREVVQPKTPKVEESQTYNEEYLDEDMEELFQPEKKSKVEQDIMKPEVMDEEVPSDCDTNVSEEDSLFDDFQSSDSDDIDEWFTLDIRDEKAGDYIPLLGSKALKLLTEEKERMATRLNNLKSSLATLNQTGRQQTEQLRKATATLAELDASLKAS